MSPDVLHRKLQKKAKRKRFRKCPQCGGRTRVRLQSRWFRHYLESDAQAATGGKDVLLQVCNEWMGCGYKKEIKLARVAE